MESSLRMAKHSQGIRAADMSFQFPVWRECEPLPAGSQAAPETQSRQDGTANRGHCHQTYDSRTRRPVPFYARQPWEQLAGWPRAAGPVPACSASVLTSNLWLAVGGGEPVSTFATTVPGNSLFSSSHVLLAFKRQLSEAWWSRFLPSWEHLAIF